MPLDPFSEAVTEVEPTATPVARPVAASMVATAGLATDQAAVAVTFAVEPLGYVAVALNCWVAPTAKVAGLGVTEIVRLATFSVALPLTPFNEAVTEVEPMATAVARPDALTVATAGLAAVQVAVAVTSCVDPSLYLAVAVNCWVAPTVTLTGLGETEMEERAGVTVSVALPLMPLSEAATEVEPAATAVATPDALTVATAGLAAVQVAFAVTFCVDPSL